MRARRKEELRDMLTAMRQEAEERIKRKIRNSQSERTHGERVPEGDLLEHVEAEVQEDLDGTLVQMDHDKLVSIRAVLIRFENDSYGNCYECGEEISAKRLKAVPFAIRCLSCEEEQEIPSNFSKVRRGSVPSFMVYSGSDS